MDTSISSSKHLVIQAAVSLIVIIPVGLWFISQPLATLLTVSGALRAMGQLCGVLGAVLFSCNFILAARISWIEEILNGLPKVYNLHHFLGGLAFILLLVHPVFLGLQYVSYSVSAAANFFLPSLNDIPKLLGLAALTTITILLVITFFIRIAYHRWKSTHQWLGLALFLASLHVYLIPGHLDSSPQLRIYMVSIMLLGLIAFLYRVLFGRWLVHRYQYIVSAVKVHGGQATEIQLTPQHKPITYKPGQFFFMRVKQHSGITSEAHPFSFTSSPGQPTVSFAAKIAGDYTGTLPNLHPGSEVDIEGPYGRFLFEQGYKKQIWIAGGIGITPFMSCIRGLHPGSDLQIHLYYIVKNIKSALFIPELKAKASTIPGLSLEIWESNKQGMFTIPLADQRSHHETSYFVCGPEGLMKDVKKRLIANSISRNSIFTEEFKLY